MQSQIKLPAILQQRLRCPVCHSALKSEGGSLTCINDQCAARFPIVRGVPVLVNEKTSLFSTEEIVSENLSLPDAQEKKFIDAIRRLVPSISANVRARENYAKLTGLLLKKSPSPLALVIGGRIPGQGAETLLNHSSITLAESDIAFGPRTNLISDAQDIPFEDGTFDAVIIQAVLEYLPDPYKCAQEIERVLKADGLVYAETPFMQQVHGGAYDFLRFTHLGHRRLFRKFTEIESGIVGGPGMALAWSYQYFLLSFSAWKPLRTALKAFAILTSFYLKYFDYYLVNRPGAFDAASGFFFLGAKQGQAISDRDLPKLYRGAV